MTNKTKSPFPDRSLLPEYQEFERLHLAGKSGQLVVLAYIDQGRRFFRFGKLAGEKLVLRDPTGHDHALTLPIATFFACQQGMYTNNVPAYHGDIFGQYPRLEHNPPHGLHDVVLGMAPLVDLHVGNKDAHNYFREHEGVELDPSDWMLSLLKNGPDEHFLAGVDPAFSAGDADL